MMYKFLDDSEGQLNTEADVLSNWADYLVVFVNRDGYLCEYQFDGGPRVHPLKWVYTSECCAEANNLLGRGLFRF